METTPQRPNLFHVAEIQLTYRPHISLTQAPSVAQSKDAYRILSSCWNPDTIGLYEEFKILLLNRGNKVLGIVNISCGGMTGTIVESKLVFAGALKAAACGLILAHNHPSGVLKPSQADLTVTERLVKAGKILEISVLDHLILSPEGNYLSFADEGLL